MAKTRNHLRIGTKLLNTDDNFISVIAPDVAPTDILAQILYAEETTDTYQGPDLALMNGLWLRYGSTNSGYGYYGNSTAVSTTDRGELAPGNVILLQIANVNELYVCASTTDSTFYWTRA